MKETKNDNSFWIILSLYLLPAFILGTWTQYRGDGWGALSLGLIIGGFGSFGLLYWLRGRELQEPHTIQTIVPVETTPPIDTIPLNEHLTATNNLQEQILRTESSLKDALEGKERVEQQMKELHHEIEELAQANAKLNDELQSSKDSLNERTEDNQRIVSEHLSTIQELREALEKKQQHVQQLETKTRDLNYELKTLLKISEKPIQLATEITPMIPRRTTQVPNEQVFDFAVRTQEEAHVHLKRILDIAQRISGGSPLASSPRFKNVSTENFALDLRRLFDSLQEIEASSVIVFSPKENKLLFVNNHIQKLTGVSVERFMQLLHDKLREGCPEWEETMRQLAFKSETKLGMPLQVKPGQEFILNGVLGIIPTGPFRQNILGVLYP